MKRLLRKLLRMLRKVGIDFRKLFRSLNGISFYLQDFKEIKKQKGTDSSFKLQRNFPILYERFENAGVAKGHYFHQDLYVAQKIFESSPKRHIDIGSRVDGFVAHVATFREIEIFDIREIESNVKNIKFRQHDLISLPKDLINSCDSISSLHAIEHFGLGRYNDPVDYWGYKKAFFNISKILKPGGTFYFSVPIGEQRIEFNAHRVFSVKHLIELMKPVYELRSFSYVDDNGGFYTDVSLTEQDIQRNFNCNYGCGIFILKKK